MDEMRIRNIILEIRIFENQNNRNRDTKQKLEEDINRQSTRQTETNRLRETLNSEVKELQSIIVNDDREHNREIYREKVIDKGRDSQIDNYIDS